MATIGMESIMASTKTGDEVGRAGAGSGAADADFAGRARIALGRKRRVLLMPYQDVLNWMIIKRIVERERDAARDSRNMSFDTFSRTRQSSRILTRTEGSTTTWCLALSP